ncbi:MAG TPA: caspase family protein, partial [Pirellulales bacterium]
MNRLLSWFGCALTLATSVGLVEAQTAVKAPAAKPPVAKAPVAKAPAVKSATQPAGSAQPAPLAGATASVKGPAKKMNNHYALLIGVNKYAPPLGELRYCNADMAALRDHFIAAGYPADHICFMEDDAQKTWLRPTKSNILTQAENWLKSLGKDDVIVIAFSGHGVRMQGKDSQKFGSYLCPGDANLDKPEDSLVSVDALYAMMQGSEAAQRLLLIDACRNDLIQEGTKAAAFTKGYADEPPPP